MDNKITVNKDKIKHLKVDLDYPLPQYGFDLVDFLDLEDYNIMFKVISTTASDAEFEIIKPKPLGRPEAV